MVDRDHTYVRRGSAKNVIYDQNPIFDRSSFGGRDTRTDLEDGAICATNRIGVGHDHSRGGASAHQRCGICTLTAQAYTLNSTPNPTPPFSPCLYFDGGPCRTPPPRTTGTLPHIAPPW
jgi:hypothetical protein